MANSLPIGNWSWNDRWKYPDEPDFGPNDERPAERAPVSLPPGQKSAQIMPSQRKFEYELEESIYTQDFGHEPVIKPQDKYNTNRRGPVPRGRMHIGGDEQKNPGYSSQLWSRINPAHAVMAYTSEANRAYVDHSDGLFETSTEHRVKVHRKDYKEAIAKAKNVMKEQKIQN